MSRISSSLVLVTQCAARINRTCSQHVVDLCRAPAGVQESVPGHAELPPTGHEERDDVGGPAAPVHRGAAELPRQEAATTRDPDT